MKRAHLESDCYRTWFPFRTDPAQRLTELTDIYIYYNSYPINSFRLEVLIFEELEVGRSLGTDVFLSSLDCICC